MSVSVTTAALKTNLTTVSAAQSLLGLDAAAKPLLEQLVFRASAAIVTHCHRSFARELVTETVPGFGDNFLMLDRTPVAGTPTITQNGEPITDFTVDNADSGLLYRKLGWTWTVGLGWNLTEYTVPRSEDPQFAVVYGAGYLMPDDDVSAQGLIATSASKTFTLSGGTMPLVVAGDRIVTSGFTQSGNNGTFTVVSRTASTIVVSEALTDELTASADIKTIAVRTLPGDIEQACLETVKAWYLGKGRDPGIVSRSVGDLSITYAQPQNLPQTLPFSAIGLLGPWVRMA